MQSTKEFDEFKKKMQNYFTKEVIEEYKEFILLDTSTGKYHPSKYNIENKKNFVFLSGFEEIAFFDMFINKLETLDQEHNQLNWCGVKKVDDYYDPLRIIRSR